jgi:membrane protease YdiL (CAAX protease family)
MPVSKRRRHPSQQTERVIRPAHASTFTGIEAFWGWTDLILYAIGMLLVVAILYQVVLHFGLSAAAAGAITDVPAPLGILYLILRLRYGRSPWTSLGWIPPQKAWQWIIAAAGGAGLGLLIMLIENPTRFQIHFHTTGDAILFGVFFAGLVEETVWRGAVLPVLLRALRNPFVAALLTGAAFSLEHAIFRQHLPSLTNFAEMTLTGTAYGLTRIYTRSTLAAAVMHGGYNLTLFFWQGA